MNSHDFSGQPRLLSGITSRSSIFLSLLLLISAKKSFEKVIFNSFLFSKSTTKISTQFLFIRGQDDKHVFEGSRCLKISVKLGQKISYVDNSVINFLLKIISYQFPINYSFLFFFSCSFFFIKIYFS